MEKGLFKSPEAQTPDWRGYTIDELRYRRAYVKVKLEMEKQQLFHRSRSMVSEGALPISGTSRKIFGKLLGALDYFDYAFIAFKTGGKLMKILRALRRSKK